MLGTTISTLRKNAGMTQEQLAQKLDVTNQAVSKWETDQCCPDVAVLPKLADIFEISMDELFGRQPKKQDHSQMDRALPWEDDDRLHLVVYEGHKLLAAGNDKNQLLTIRIEGTAKDISCNCNLECEDVAGNIHVGGYVECGDIGGSVVAGAYVECADVGGAVTAGGYVECGDVGDSVTAEGYVECGDVGGSVKAGHYVECGDVGADVVAGDYVECGTIGGRISAADRVETEEDHENVTIRINGKKIKWNPFKK